MPWVLAKSNNSRLETVIYNLLETIKIGTILAQSFVPDAAKKVLKGFGFDGFGSKDDIQNFGCLESGTTLCEVPMLFPRLDVEKEIDELAQLA